MSAQLLLSEEGSVVEAARSVIGQRIRSQTVEAMSLRFYPGRYSQMHTYCLGDSDAGALSIALHRSCTIAKRQAVAG